MGRFLLAGAMLLLAAGCGAGRENAPRTLRSCPPPLLWHGTSYAASGTRVPRELGERLGKGTIPGCDAGPSRHRARVVSVLRINGVPPDVAVAAHDEPTSVYLAHDFGKHLSPELTHMLLGPSCAEDKTFVLTGAFLDDTEWEQPPYLLSVHESDPVGRRYLGLDVEVQVTGSTTGITKLEQLRAAAAGRTELRLSVRMHCRRAKLPNQTFVADRITIAAPWNPMPNYSKPLPLCAPQKTAPPCGPGAKRAVFYPFILRTHCGVRDAYFNGRLWVVDPPLDDGSGNPPREWANPEHRGLMRLLTPRLAEFRSGSSIDVYLKPARRGYEVSPCE